MSPEGQQRSCLRPSNMTGSRPAVLDLPKSRSATAVPPTVAFTRVDRLPRGLQELERAPLHLRDFDPCAVAPRNPSSDTFISFPRNVGRLPPAHGNEQNGLPGEADAIDRARRKTSFPGSPMRMRALFQRSSVTGASSAAIFRHPVNRAEELDAGKAPADTLGLLHRDRPCEAHVRPGLRVMSSFRSSA
jgi:hypothetical protein